MGIAGAAYKRAHGRRVAPRTQRQPCGGLDRAFREASEMGTDFGGTGSRAAGRVLRRGAEAEVGRLTWNGRPPTAVAGKASTGARFRSDSVHDVSANTLPGAAASTLIESCSRRAQSLSISASQFGRRGLLG